MKQIKIILLISSILFALYILLICFNTIQRKGTLSNEIIKEKQELGY